MYIEMTTFAIPTFLIALAKALAITAVAYVGILVLIALFCVMFYPPN